MEEPFYGRAQARIHHDDFGRLAAAAASDLLAALVMACLDSGTVVDLGCGSGILARHLVDAGYRVIGVDISPAMIDLARENVPTADLRCQSLWDLELPSCVAVTALGEALNYATDPASGFDALADLTRRVHRVLAPGGVFLFDVATPGRTGPGRVAQQFHDRDRWTLYMRAEERDGDLHRWITIFERRDDGSYQRVDEHHVLRLYDPAGVEATLRDAGFEVDTRHDYVGATGQQPPGWRVFLGRRPPSEQWNGSLPASRAPP